MRRLAAHGPFTAQEALRLENPERRRTVLARLLAFEAAQNSEHTDWRLMMVVLREAPQEWRHIFPVDRSTQLALQEEFESALTRLRARLGAWLSENAAAKKALILRAQQLLTKDDHRDAVDGVKFLQQRWQESGPAAHPEDQVLWQEFRQHCDAVFQKRQQAQSQYADTLAANKDQAIALCTEIELAATASGSALLESMTKMPHWHAAFAAISELPRADERALQARFERAVKRCQSQLTLQRSRDQLRSLECLLQSAQLIRAYGQTVARDGTASEREAAKIAAEAFIAAVPHWPKGSAPALKDAWHQAETASAAALASNETALRTVCIRGELLKNLVSPLEDQQLRRNYQLQRLVQSMGQHVNATDVDYDAQLLALVLDWIRVGPVTEGLHESLCARFTHLVMDRHERQ